MAEPPSLVEPLKVANWISGGTVVKEKLLKEVDVCCSFLKRVKSCERELGGARFFEFITMVWDLDTRIAMDAAEAVCHHLRESGCLCVMLNLLSGSEDSAIELIVCKGIEQSMTSSNRMYIVEHEQFETFVGVACTQVGPSVESSRCGTGILENLFKHSAQTCVDLIHSKALESVLRGCRSMDEVVLQHCAAALANCAMYGGRKCQVKMLALQVDVWLFPLAFSQNDVVKYYALLAIVFIASNPDLQMKVERSGTLEMVVPYLNSQDPEELPRKCQNHAHGRSASWLQKLVPLLLCANEEARHLAAFHFAMEVGVKKKQQRLKLFREIGAIEALFQSARESSRLTSDLCCQALRTCEEDLPAYLYWDVLNWSCGTVRDWVRDIQLADQADNFSIHCVTGDLLLELTMDDLLALSLSKLQSRWFLQQVGRLRSVADVAGRDYYHMAQWLAEVGRDLRKYTVNFVTHSVSPAALPYLTEDILKEVGICSSVDRLRLLLAAKQLQSSEDTSTTSGNTSSHDPQYDVFISYRRSNGSQLASLLKVHLELKGYKVFIDVKELGSGNFCDALLRHINHSSCLIVVLSPNALDRCKEDVNNEDWLRKEVAHALSQDVQVVPLTDPSFQWPKDSELPEDIRRICSLNGVSWSHDYQDACVSKLVSFFPQSVTYSRSNSRKS